MFATITVLAFPPNESAVQVSTHYHFRQHLPQHYWFYQHATINTGWLWQAWNSMTTYVRWSTTYLGSWQGLKSRLYQAYFGDNKT